MLIKNFLDIFLVLGYTTYEVISVAQAIKMQVLTEEEISRASDELYQKVIVETENSESRPAKEVLEEVRKKYAKF